jgi:hypothetical protein
VRWRCRSLTESVRLPWLIEALVASSGNVTKAHTVYQTWSRKLFERDVYATFGLSPSKKHTICDKLPTQIDHKPHLSLQTAFASRRT